MAEVFGKELTMKQISQRELSHAFSLLMVCVLLSATAMTSPALATPGDEALVSVGLSGSQADAISYSGEISANGRFVVFEQRVTITLD